MIEFEFYGGETLQEMFRESNELLRGNKSYYKEVYCNKFTPFSVLIKDIVRSIRNVVNIHLPSLHFDGNILDLNKNPAFYEITNGSQVIIETVKPEPGSDNSKQCGVVQRELKPPADICAICRGDFVDLTLVKPCKHEFCYPCINEWFRILNLDEIHCPMCRTPANEIWKVINPKLFQRFSFRERSNAGAMDPNASYDDIMMAYITNNWAPVMINSTSWEYVNLGIKNLDLIL
ncbi:hypothetical protein B4U80_13289 [Leptotrombidium deliense]|uniref:RING-type domain-containing protein n=1 Tax=Leptotrombidium deliense TaxID=299467 RepID=A0A443S8W6_9ACAR|nr:hypothetical protein B4U80_13289 [Leptotrombidium deliense]